MFLEFQINYNTLYFHQIILHRVYHDYILINHQICLSIFKGSEVGGPISLIKSGSDIAEKGGANGGAGSLIGFAAAVSVNLAVLNALPFPVLDGGTY